MTVWELAQMQTCLVWLKQTASPDVFLFCIQNDDNKVLKVKISSGRLHQADRPEDVPQIDDIVSYIGQPTAEAEADDLTCRRRCKTHFYGGWGYRFFLDNWAKEREGKGTSVFIAMDKKNVPIEDIKDFFGWLTCPIKGLSDQTPYRRNGSEGYWMRLDDCSDATKHLHMQVRWDAEQKKWVANGELCTFDPEEVIKF